MLSKNGYLDDVYPKQWKGAHNLGKKSTKQNFLQGAFILVAATVLVKVIGALFKIPLANLVGGVSSGFFASAYNLFTPIYAVCVAGLPGQQKDFSFGTFDLFNCRFYRDGYHCGVC